MGPQKSRQRGWGRVERKRPSDYQSLKLRWGRSPTLFSAFLFFPCLLTTTTSSLKSCLLTASVPQSVWLTPKARTQKHSSVYSHRVGQGACHWPSAFLHQLDSLSGGFTSIPCRLASSSTLHSFLIRNAASLHNYLWCSKMTWTGFQKMMLYTHQLESCTMVESLATKSPRRL